MLLTNILLGISLAAPIGPLSIEAIRRGLRFGFLSAFIVCMGGAIGDSLYLFLTFFGLGSFITQPIVKISIWCFGSTLLAILGYQNLRDSFSKKPLELNLDQTVQRSKRRSLIVGTTLAVANPMTVVWWLGIFGAALGASDEDSSIFSHLTIILGVIIWAFILSGATALGKRFLKDKHFKVISFLAGLSLLGFAIYFGLQVVRALALF